MRAAAPHLFALACVGVCLLSACLVWLSIHYAHRLHLIDHPGQRRSHSEPTPRGGGIAIAAAALLWGGGAAAAAGDGVGGLPALAILLVAAIGWMDDHRDVRPVLRLAVQCVAAALLAAAMAPAAIAVGAASPFAAGWTVAAVLVFASIAVVWSINLHNFMDGINGLLAWQALFVFGVLGALLAHAGELDRARDLAIWIAAIIGFLPFNFPRARIFMGDVGSGVLGLLVAMAVLWQMATPGIALTSGLVACSAFVTDATCTLLSRILRGRRWYSAHREHLYQWLVRCGYSHAQIVALYMGWNLVIALPVICWMNFMADAADIALGATVVVYAVATVVWWYGKRSCLRAISVRRLHVAA